MWQIFCGAIHPHAFAAVLPFSLNAVPSARSGYGTGIAGTTGASQEEEEDRMVVLAPQILQVCCL